MAAALALPVVLVYSSVRTFRELDEQKQVYLRDRAAAIAARLETIPPETAPSALAAMLGREEPALADLRVLARGDATGGNASLNALWEGRELFRTEMVAVNGERRFRAWVPVHMDGTLHLARIDLTAGAADFLLQHARHNVILSTATGIALVTLSLFLAWSLRRSSAMEKRQLELEHMAHVGKLSAVLAHEIRNPLGTIKGFTQLASERASVEVRGMLDPVLTEIRRMERLVTDLLLYGRPPQPASRMVPWREVEQALESHMRPAIDGRAIALTLPRESPLLETDPDLLGQVLVNLARNAAEAIGEGPGEIRVELRRAARAGVEIAVLDDGPGLGKETRGKLFQPFFTTKASGSGLGLPISRKLAESLGGRLELRPRRPHGVEALLSFSHMRSTGAEADTAETQPLKAGRAAARCWGNSGGPARGG